MNIAWTKYVDSVFSRSHILVDNAIAISKKLVTSIERYVNEI